MLVALTSLGNNIEIFWDDKHHEAKLELAEDYSPPQRFWEQEGSL